MGARELLEDLTDAGLCIEADSDRLVVGPASKLTDDLRARLRAFKPELLALLLTPTPSGFRTSQCPDAGQAVAPVLRPLARRRCRA